MRKSWTDAMIAEALLKISNGTGRMPSVQELRDLGRNDLACVITKQAGGMIAWASRLGLSRKESDSDFGWMGEKKLALMLQEMGYCVQANFQIKYPFDLLIDGVLRIDVKTARFAEYGPSKGWFFRIGKTPQADIVALLQYDTDVVYFVPWHLCPRTNMTISRTGKAHEKFKNRFDIITTLVAARKQELALWPSGEVEISEGQITA